MPEQGPLRLFDGDDLNFSALFALSAAAYGAGEVGEVVATVDQINSEGGGYQHFFDSFMALGQRLASAAEEAHRKNRFVTARDAHRRAAQYFDQALFFVLGTSTPEREPEVYELMQGQWDAATQLESPPFEHVQIPYDGGSLNGYFLPARGVTGPRPTVIVCNGSDLQYVDTYAYGGAAGMERGYHTLLFEGPGQGGELFLRQTPFRPDWEHVITPIVDVLVTRPDVDPQRIALTGWSMTGSLVVRAAAHERRLAALVCDPGSVNPWLAWPAELRSLFDGGATKDQVNQIWEREVVPALSGSEKFNIAKRAEIFGPQFLDAARRGQLFTDFWTLGQEMMRYDITDVAADVTCPTLVTGYEGETFYPGQDVQLYDLLRAPKEHYVFTAADGAELHCAPMAPTFRNEIVFDWLDEALA